MKILEVKKKCYSYRRNEHVQKVTPTTSAHIQHHKFSCSYSKM